MRNEQGREILHNIADDPEQVHNLAEAPPIPPGLEQLRATLARLVNDGTNDTTVSDQGPSGERPNRTTRGETASMNPASSAGSSE
jgi:hypothetical protein